MSADHWLSRLARRFGLIRSNIPADVTEALSDLQTTVAALTEVQTQNQAALIALQETLEKFEKQQARAGKEQFKANLLSETQLKSFKTTLEHLQDAESYRERELGQLREKLTTARNEGRLEIIKSVLPALDGLDEALASGERLLKSKLPAQLESRPRTPKATFTQRLNAATKILFQPAATGETPVEILAPEAVAAWLQGLTFVQDRLLSVLAAEGVHPIETDGEVFDPHLHVAIETIPARDGVDPGTIVHGVRRGYAMDETVLRFAEVVVARSKEIS